MHNSHNKLRTATITYASTISRLSYASGYAVREVPTRGFAWFIFLPPSQRLPEAGWKLHVSVSTVRADENIAAVVQVLLEQNAAFKVPATLDGLIKVNSGQAGITQIGKIVTVYPPSDDDLVRISRSLSDTQFVPGPVPPSDYVVDGAPGQSIRWGAFRGTRVRWTPLGRPYFEIQALDGAWIEDSREPVRADTAVPRPVPSSVRPDLSVADEPVTIGADTIVPLSRLSHGPRSRVDIALRMPAIDSCVLKRARVKVAEDIDGNCARVRLANEARVLALVAGEGLAPSLIAYADVQDALVMSDEGGEAIQKLHGATGLRQIVAASKSLGRLHAKGVVHRDAKLANAVWHRNGRLVWVDFELAAQVGQRHPIAAGTYGYIPPEGTCAVVHPSYDVYAIGASLAKWCLGIDPSRLPLLNSRHRIRRMLVASGQTAAESLYAALSDSRPASRPSAATAAAEIQSLTTTLLAQRKHRTLNVSSESLQRWAGQVASRALPALEAFEGPTLGTWRNCHLFSDICCTGINIGASGILLGLMHLAGRGKEHGRLDRWIRSTASNLCREAFDCANRGFFTGFTGAAVALAVAGTRLRKPQYTQRAIDLLVSAAAIDDGECDLFSGDAGVLWAGAHIARITGNGRIIVDALRPVAQRIRKRATYRQGMPWWPATSAYDPQCKVFLGAAHGASGIALGLAEWAGLAGGQASAERQMAKRVFEAIFRVAQDAGQPNTPETLDGTFRPPQYWCHGVAGYLWCLIQSFPSDGDLRPALRWAIQAFDATSRDADLPTMCHGLAGMLELSTMTRAWAMEHGTKLDAQRSTNRCQAIAFNLRCIQQPFRHTTVWSSEDPAEITPDLWVGFLGPIVALHRYARGQGDSMLAGSALARLAQSNALARRT